MRIAIGADHRGYELKKFIQDNVQIHEEIKWIDVGTYEDSRTDYPLYTLPVCLEVLQESAERGILICATGLGMVIAANRFAHIYAALVWNEEVARLAKEHNNANILVLPADFVTNEQAVKMIQAWLNAEFLGDRYKLRIDMIDSITETSGEVKEGCC